MKARLHAQVVQVLMLVALVAACARTLEVPQPVPNQGYLGGRLVEADPGTDLTRPIAQGSISIPNTNLSAVSDVNGNFVIGPLPEGRYRLQFSGASSAGGQRKRLLSSVGVTRGATTSLGDISLKQNAELAGRVLLGTQQLGNAGITVFVPGTDFVTTTADSGAWLLRQLPEGVVRAAAFRPGYRPATTTDLVIQGGTVTSAIDLVITPEPPLKALLAGTVLVLDAPNSGGVVVKVLSLTSQKTLATATTSPDGAFALADLDPDLYTLTAEAPDRPVARVPNLAVGAGLEVRLADPIVLGKAGSAAANAQCTDSAQCDAGRVCSNGTCADCASSSQCGAGSSCRSGRCQRDCTSNADCPGQVCGAGRCRPCAASAECGSPALVCSGAGQCAHCRDRLDCAAGQACLPPGCGSCAVDVDCGAGATCVSGSCVPGSCSSNDGCPLARACVSHACGSCSADLDCRFGQLCVTGVCISGNCRTSAQCSGGLTCTAFQCAACNNDGDCGTGQLCLPTAQGQRCSPGDCRDTSNCSGAKSGLVCFGNTCTSCGGPVSCAAGQVCSSGVCLNVPLHTVTVAISGSGAVTGSPGTISCAGGSGTCSGVFKLGDQLTLTASPAAAFFFGGWSGAPGCSGSPSCTFVVTSDVIAAAVFNAGAPLSVATVGPGTVTSSPAAISCPGTCSATFAIGAVITLTATPVFGYALAGWSGGGCTGTGPCATTLAQATTVTATFVKEPVLTVAPGGAGTGTITSSPAGINCTINAGALTGSCSAPFGSGTAVKLSASSTPSAFGGWLSGGCSGAGSCNLALVADTTVSATFGTVVTLSLTVTGPGAVSADSGAIANCGAGGSCSGSYPAGTAVQLTSTPRAGAALSGWGSDCAASTGTICTLSMSQARTASATFTTVTALSPLAGDLQSAPAGTPLPGSVILKVAAVSGGAPLASAPVTLAGPPGSVVTPRTAISDATGQAVFAVRLSRTLGAQTFTASTPTAQLGLTVTGTATAPAAGLISTLVNIDHVAGSSGIPGPGITARINSPSGLAMALDGTLFLSSFNNNQIFALSPAGVLSVLAGTGSCGHAGDLGPATAAQLCNPYDLALDETNGRRMLYVADGNAIRAIDLLASTPSISTFAGGGTAGSPGYGDGGPATSAALSAPQHIALDPAGAFLYVVDNGIARFRRIDLSTRLISTWLSVPANVICGASNCAGYVHDCGIAFDPQGTAYVTWDPFVYNGCTGGSGGAAVFRVGTGGSTTQVAGGGTSTSDGVPPLTASFAPAASRLLFDKGGNLFVVENQGHRIRRIEAGVGRISTLAGTGTAGFAGELSDARQAQLSYPFAAVFDANQNLIFSDGGNSSLRTIWSAGAPAAATATLSITSANPQTVVVDQAAATLSVKLLDPAGQPLVGYTVNWGATDPGGAIYTSNSSTNSAGVAASLARGGLLPNASYRFTAAFTPFGGPAPASSVTLTVNTTPPQAGAMFSIVDPDHLSGADGVPGPATRAHVNDPTGTAVAKDGTLYLADYTNNQVYALSPSGALSLVAGTGTCGHAGDGGAATAAQICNPLDLALDETHARRTLYLIDTSLVRAVDLTAATPTISTFAGGGTAATGPAPGYGDGNAATFAVLNFPQHLAVDPAGNFLYLVDNGAAPTAPAYGTGRFRRVDLSTGKIDTWLSVPANVICGPSNCSAYVHDCAIGFDPQGTAYVSWDPFVFNGCTGGAGGGAVFRTGPGTPPSTTLVAGGGSNTGEGVLATSASLSPALSQVFIEPAGKLYVVERLAHRIRKLSDLTASATVSTVVGTGAAGNGADFLSPLGTALNSPWSIAVLPDGKMVIADSGNHVVRTIWPPYP